MSKARDKCRFHLEFEDSIQMPKNFSAALRQELVRLAPPPHCLRFTGCVRLVYRAAKQVGVKVVVRKQKRGSYLVWKPANQPGFAPGSAAADAPMKTFAEDQKPE
ncbi:MAG: hypothetical protein U1F83_15400 [Verrucomicrobiota bacterium]